jgi:putative membrane-bound dehydrogenase-like protein
MSTAILQATPQSPFRPVLVSHGAVWLLAAAACLAMVASVRADPHHVPSGFSIQKVAGAPEIRFPMFAAFDDQGRLFVAESSGGDLYAEIRALTRACRIRMLEDRTGDGRFDTSTVFADRINFPMGLVWHEGRLLVADPPDLVALSDTNHDGVADRREVILTGFGHLDNGSLHGLIIGPDQRLYMTMGTPDGYRLQRSDGSILSGRSGALIRSRPDGSDVEVLSRGFVNLVEVAFTATGEPIGTLNWYQEPVGGTRDALVHLVEGGLYPMELEDAGTRFPVTGDPLPALALFPAVAPSGFERYRGASFPASYRDNLFTAQHNRRAIGHHQLIVHGATFRAEHDDLVTSDDPDFHPSDVIEDADGSLLILDTGSWYYQHCPTGRIRRSPAMGGIYRVRYDAAAPVSDPWGLTIDWANASGGTLARHLADARPAVRSRAQQVLSNRGATVIPILNELLTESTDPVARRNALWTLGMISHESARASVRQALTLQSPDLVVIASKILGLHRDADAAPLLSGLLTAPRDRWTATGNSDSALATHVPRAAAEALARCGNPDMLPVIWTALTNSSDAFLEHALIHAAHWLADESALVSALDHPHPRVQKAALLLLDQPPRPVSALSLDQVHGRAGSTDPGLRRVALSILERRPQWASFTTALLKEWLDQPALSAEQQTALRALVPVLQSNSDLQQLIGSALTDASHAIRSHLVEAIAHTTLPELPATWQDGLRRALKDPALDIRSEAVATIFRLRLSEFDHLLASLAADESMPDPLRLEALRVVLIRQPRPAVSDFGFLAAQLESDRDPAVRLTAAEILRRCHLDDSQILALLRKLGDQHLISPSTLLPAWRAFHDPAIARVVLEELDRRMQASWRPGPGEISGLIQRLPAELREPATRLERHLAMDLEAQRDLLDKFEPLLRGGDPDRGHAVFFGPKAACASCHGVGAQGSIAGPDLTSIGAIRSGPDLLEAILFPSSTFAQGFEPYAALMSDGQEWVGHLVGQNPDAVVLRDAAGMEIRLNPRDIQQLDRLDISLMPEGLETALTESEFRDLLAFLKSLQ